MTRVLLHHRRGGERTAGNFDSRDFAVRAGIREAYRACIRSSARLSFSLFLSRRLFSSSLDTNDVVRVVPVFTRFVPVLCFSFFFLSLFHAGTSLHASIVPRRFWQRRQCAVLGRRPNVINCKSGHCFPAREFNVTRWGSLRVSFDLRDLHSARHRTSAYVAIISISLFLSLSLTSRRGLGCIIFRRCTLDATVDKHHCPDIVVYSCDMPAFSTME